VSNDGTEFTRVARLVSEDRFIPLGMTRVTVIDPERPQVTAWWTRALG
jgi:hypothetical protein